MRLSNILECYNQNVTLQYTTNDLIDTKGQLFDFILNNKEPLLFTGSLGKLEVIDAFWLPKPNAEKSTAVRKWIPIGAFNTSVRDGVTFIVENVPVSINPRLLVIPLTDFKPKHMKEFEAFWERVKAGDTTLGTKPQIAKQFADMLQNYLGEENSVYYHYYDFFSVKQFKRGVKLKA
jgi:hypothetical protein